MDNAAIASETSVRRAKRGRAPEAVGSDGVAPSKSSVSIGERSERKYREQQPDQGSGDGSFGDDVPEEEPTPKPKRKRGGAGNGATVAATEDLGLMDVVKSSNKKLVHVASKQWVERYEKDATAALGELLMMLFESCGAKYQLDASSLDETDVDDVVLELVDLARNGEVEDLYNSKAKELRSFKENLSIFWEDLVLECQNGPLFDKILFEKCMDYIIALSCTPPRVYRQVASMVGLQLVTSFITVAKMLGTQRDTTQRQLNAEKKKRNDGPRVELLNKRLSMTHENINVMEEMMRKIFTGLFMHRYRDVDPNIRMSCIRALGIWIASYSSLFLQDLYLKYLGWTLNDKSSLVRKTSVLALQNLYEVDDYVPLLSLFTERFCNRMIDLADDIDVSVAVCAIGLLKLLLRHQLLTDDELGPLYDLLIDEPPLIRRAIGQLVYDHLIAQKVSGSQSVSRGEDDESSEVHLGRMLQILREFPNDPILSAYVIDDVWDDMKAMKDWKCIVSMLLDENPMIELTDVDATNLVRLLYASAKKAIGEKIVPTNDNRKPYYNKAQKEALENFRREITSAMMKSYPQLLQKYISDKAKVSPLVEIVMLLKLELFTLKRQEQNFKTILELICDAFFKHGEEDALRSCIKAIVFCACESQADLQDFTQNKLKELENELVVKLKTAMKEVAVGDDEYSLLVNLKRLYEVQKTKCVPNDTIYEDMANILVCLKDVGDEVLSFLFLNMYLHIAWCLQSIDSENPSEAIVAALLTKRNSLFQILEGFLDSLLEENGRNGRVLASRVCIILAEMWHFFRKSRYVSSKLESLGYCPSTATLQKFWKLCEKQLNVSDETEDDDANEEYIEETNKYTITIAAAKLVASGTVSKDYLGPQIISHFAMHGASVAEIIKHLITVLKKDANDDLPAIFLEALKRAYRRQMVDFSTSDESLGSKSLLDCKELAVRLSGTFIGAARNKHKVHILKVVKDGISFAFMELPKQLSFLECAILPFVSKLPTSDVLDILRDVQKRSENVNTDEDPSGWRPYYTFVDHLREKYAKNEGFQDEREVNTAKRRGRPRKLRNLQGKKLFDAHASSADEDSISTSDQNDQDEDDEEEEQPLIHSFRSSASKLRSMKVPQQETKGQSGNSRTTGSID
uniref:Cohesin subunit SA-3 n=1 Tax=Anthurium amnicola TaxID=1678845 RepID=A0A1D1XSG5_9ARAE